MKRNLGMTVLELLTVTAITGTMAALLLPAVHSGLETANSAKCASNLRQLGLAFQMYLEDNNGVFPVQQTQTGEPAWNMSHPQDMYGWQFGIADYLHDKGAFSDGGKKNIFYCPDNPLDVDGGVFTNLHTSYACNCRIEDYPQSGNGHGGHCVADVANPEDFILLSDTPLKNSLRWFDWYPNLKHNMGFIHNGKANCLLLSGRMQSMSFDEIQPKNITCTGKVPDMY